MPATHLIRASELRGRGWSKRELASAVADGRLIAVRKGAYAVPDTHDDLITAGRMRGRVTGTSALRRLGVFVVENECLHVNVPPTASRFPSPVRPHRIHRRVLLRTPHPDGLLVEPLDAVYDAVVAQPPRAGIATIDSALHLGVLRLDELDELFAALPRRFRRLRRLLDPRAESGPESLVRLMLRALGCSFECQVTIPGVGRVDFLVDGWLIIECDSAAHHSSWDAQRRDRRRDAAAAQRGLATLRVIAEDILWHPDEVVAAIAGLVGSRPVCHEHARVARRRPTRGGFAD